jgi:hypothetical protein
MAHYENKFLLGNKNQSLFWVSYDSNIYKYIWDGNKIVSQIKKRGTVTPNLVSWWFSDNQKDLP